MEKLIFKADETYFAVVVVDSGGLFITWKFYLFSHKLSSPCNNAGAT